MGILSVTVGGDDTTNEGVWVGCRDVVAVEVIDMLLEIALV
jgi:hypothetical protein